MDIVSWAEGTDSQIADMVAALDTGKITVEETGWKVGDVRSINLGSFTYYTAHYNPPQTTQAQTAQLVIMNVGGKTFRGNGNSLDGKTCHFVVGFKTSIISTTWYQVGTLPDGRSKKAIADVENSAYNALPSSLKPIFKKFEVITYINESLGTTEQYFTLPAEKEIFGKVINSVSSEADQLSQLDYYKIAINRVPGWTRSEPSSGGLCYVNSDRTSSISNGCLVSPNGFVPYGCI